MIFKYNKRRVIEEVTARSFTMIFLFYLGYNFNLINFEPKVDYTFSIIWFITTSLHVYKVLKIIISRWKKSAIFISDKTIEFPVTNELIPWENIQNLTYEIGLRDSFLILELNSKRVKKKNNKLLNY